MYKIMVKNQSFAAAPHRVPLIDLTPSRQDLFLPPIPTSLAGNFLP